MVKYNRGFDFPNEGFIQTAIEKFFIDHRYRIISEGYADLVCISDETSEKWIIEAKGEATSIGLDFRTGLGQLLQRMDDPKTNYAMAIPNTVPFIKQCRQIPIRIRTALNLYLLLVDGQGKIQIVSPQKNIESEEYQYVSS